MDYEDYAEFCDQAQSELQREVSVLAAKSLECLTAIESYWHPSGFAVFYLNDEHRLGKLRLHIWPEGERTVRSENAPVHTHVWHLCSLVLTGVYAETIYDIVEQHPSVGVTYSSAVINYMVDKDTLHSAGEEHLNPRSKIVVGRGEFHTVSAGVPHETLVSSDEFVATLLITSYPITDLATMYSPTEISTGSYRRPMLTLGQKTNLIRRLIHELSH